MIRTMATEKMDTAGMKTVVDTTTAQRATTRVDRNGKRMSRKMQEAKGTKPIQAKQMRTMTKAAGRKMSV